MSDHVTMRQAATETILKTDALTKRFGGVVALDGLQFSMARGEVCGIIGPNGSGKSTLVGLLGGALVPTSGTIAFDGRAVTGLGAADRARNGIARTYQIPRPFLDMTIAENVQVAQVATGFLNSFASLAEETERVLERTGLGDVARVRARDLPLLRRKRLEVARALALRPKLLMLDEVGAGLVAHEIDELVKLIHSLADGSLSIIIVEHILRIVRECCPRLVVLNRGAKLIEGRTADVLADDGVAAVYLGASHVEVKGDRQMARDERDATLVRAGQDDAPQILKLSEVCAGYGQANVLDQVSLDIHRGEAVAVLGANGAGKTTLVNVIAGSIPATGGRIVFDGADIGHVSAFQRSRGGIAHCMEGRRIFSTLNVEENLLVAARGMSSAERQRLLDTIYDLFPVLAERRAQLGTTMSGGQQQMLAIGRALMSRPTLAIFDEISLGLAPVVMDQLYDALGMLRRDGLSMMIVEQDVDRVLDLADRVYVLQNGRVALSGLASEIRSDPRMRALYLGSEI
jgi:ABC-type branched-subunit amino acid transport system ATPase component